MGKKSKMIYGSWCPACGAQFFLQEDNLQQGVNNIHCWGCNIDLVAVFEFFNDGSGTVESQLTVFELEYWKRQQK